MDGVALAARFSWPTSQRNYCGPDGAPPHLYRLAVEGRGRGEARADLERFEALMPYLRAIAARHGLDPLDERVVEAYWLGNELLDAFDGASFSPILDGLGARGLPDSIARRLREHLPDDALPHHLFHVAFVGVGAVTGHVPTTLANMERCRPSAVRVVGREDGRLRGVGDRLVARDGGLHLEAGAECALPWDARLLPDLRVGEHVAVHWETPVLRLSEAQRAALELYGLRALAAANRAFPRLGIDWTAAPDPQIRP